MEDDLIAARSVFSGSRERSDHAGRLSAVCANSLTTRKVVPRFVRAGVEVRGQETIAQRETLTARRVNPQTRHPHLATASHKRPALSHGEMVLSAKHRASCGRLVRAGLFSCVLTGLGRVTEVTRDGNMLARLACGTAQLLQYDSGPALRARIAERTQHAHAQTSRVNERH